MAPRGSLNSARSAWRTAPTTRSVALAERYGFTPKVCRPYRAQTKGKVERFNHYLKNSFVVPLAASLNQVNLLLDVEVANSKIGPWLMEIANARTHATTGEIPQHRCCHWPLVAIVTIAGHWTVELGQSGEDEGNCLPMLHLGHCSRVQT